jgi:predicted  nucleic acid-binding Zn-ribbon protein
MTQPLTDHVVDLERRIAELERQLADMRSQRQYWNSKAEDQAALVEQLKRQLAEARAALTSGEATLPKIV